MVAALALGGCGQTELSDADGRAVADAEGDLSFYCSPAFRDESPGDHALFARRAPAHVDRLIRLHRQDPDAVYRASSESERTMRVVLQNAVTNLRHCDRRLAGEVERELQR
jgi:hypothetical protein